MFLDPRDVLLDRHFRLQRIRGRRETHHEQGLAARVDDQVLVRLRVDHDGLERVLCLRNHRLGRTDEDCEHRSERVHVDTFGSMFAVLVGSAETVISEAKDSLESVVIHSKSNKYLIIHAGRKALLVMRLPPSADPLKTKMAV